jgi:hypothetical protein
MNSEIQSLLKSPLPADRKRGLQMLAKSDDPQDLKVLSALHKRETDPELKQLIVQVGKTVKQRVDAASVSPAPVSKPASSLPKPMSKAAISTGGGSNQAAALMQQAQEALIELDFDNAKALARKAFTLNPDLQHDEDARNLAGDIFATSADDAVAQLLGKSNNSTGGADVLDWVDGVSSVDRGKPKRKSKVTEDTITWSQALFSLFILSIVVFAINVVIGLAETVVTRDLSERFVEEFYAASEYASPADMQAVLMENLSEQTSLPAIIINSIFATVVTVIITLVFYGVVHLVSSVAFGGNGTFKGLIYWSNALTVATYVIIYIVATLMGYFFVQEMLNNVSLLDPSFTEEQFSQAFAGMLSPIYSGMGIAFLIWIGWGFFWSGTVGKNYQFSTGRGCFSVIASHILMLVAGCACIFAFSAFLANLFSPASF